MDLNFSPSQFDHDYEIDTSQVLETQFEIEQDNHKKTRRGNYTTDEDEALVRAWLHISEDAVIGRDQKSSRLWERVVDMFHQFLGQDTERNAQGLQNRWKTISHDVSKFCGHYQQVVRLNESGWSEEMKIVKAKEQFGKIEGARQTKPVKFYKFKFEHCWKLLKNSSKWNEYVLVRNTSKTPKRKSTPITPMVDMENIDSPLISNSSGLNSILLDDDVSPIHETHLKRPKGRKKLKAKRKKENIEDESTLYLKSINEAFKETVIIEKEKWEAKKKRMEQKVMTQSMVGLTPEQQAYWNIQQATILER